MQAVRKLSPDHANLSWKKLDKYADINHHKKLIRSESIELLRFYFDKLPALTRDPRAGEALDELEHAPPSRQHFVEYLVTLYRCGFLGSEISQDLQAAAIRRSTHAHRFGERTLRDAANWAASHGYITKTWKPIGKRCTTVDGDWRTKRIRRYSLTYKIRLLVAIIRQSKQKNLPCPTSEVFADNPNGESPARESKIPIAGRLSRHCQIIDQDVPPCDPRAEESAIADKSTRPPRSASAGSETVEHETSNQSAAPPRRAPSKRAPRFAHRDRVETPRSYRAARIQFLHDLWIYLKPGTAGARVDAEQLYRIAELQTEPFYPEYLPAALEWSDVLYPLYVQDWHGRRKTIDKRVSPALRNYAAAWRPPAPAGDDGPDIAQTQKWELSLCPEPSIFFDSETLRAFYDSWPFMRAYLSAIHDGRAKFNFDDLKKYRFCNIFR